MKVLRDILPFLLVIAAGLIIFLLDLFEFSSQSARHFILIPLALFKSGYFIWLLLRRLRESAGEEFYFQHFARFVALNVLLIVISFAVDYYCLFRIDTSAFRDIPSHGTVLTELTTFFYFSVSTFTTAGFGDIVPVSMAARGFVTLQLSIGWLCTILVIGNVAHLRDGMAKKKRKD